MNKDKGMKVAVVLLLTLASCTPPVDEALRADCGSYWGMLRVGMPEDRLVCSFEGWKPYALSSDTSDLGTITVYRGAGVEGYTKGPPSYVTVVDGKVAAWGN